MFESEECRDSDTQISNEYAEVADKADNEWLHCYG